MGKQMVDGAITILKDMSSSMARMIPYIMEKNIWNHQPDGIYHSNYVWVLMKQKWSKEV